VTAYANRTRRPPRTPTDAEIARVLKVSGAHREGFRDHVILSVAVGLGLRESEIVGLNVGVILTKDRNVRRVFQLEVFKRAPRDVDPATLAKMQRSRLGDATYYKLEKYARVEKLGEFYDDAPVFWSKKGNRLSTRAVRAMWHKWQRAARFDHLYPFHALRHYAITSCRRRTGDLRKAQTLARHANYSTTTIYDEVSDEEMTEAVRGQPG
jgi:integrase/recombinase XerC